MKISKLCMIVFLIMILGITGLLASDTRIKTLGFGNIANYYVRDSYNVWSFPSTIVNYKNMVFFESSYPDESWQLWSGGIQFPVGKNITLGVYLQNSKERILYTDTQFNNSWELDPLYPFIVDRQLVYPGMDYDEVAHQFTILGGIQLQNINIGFSIQSFSSRLTYTDPDTSIHNFEDKLSARKYAIGIGLKINPRSRFDGTIFYSSSSFSHFVSVYDPIIRREPDGYNTYGIGARLFYALSPKMIIVPFLSYSNGGQGYRSLDLNDNLLTHKSTFNEYLLGCALDFIPVQKTLVTLAGGYSKYSSTLDEETWSEGTPPLAGKYGYQILPFLCIGLEAKLTKWLGARFSAYELLETIKGELPVTDTQMNEATGTGSSYGARFGLYFTLGRFTIDTLIDENGAADFLHNGLFILSGKDYSERGLFTQISVTYNFK